MSKIDDLISDANVVLVVEQDETPVAGNFATGDAVADRAYEQTILSRLDNGDEWAWAQVEVYAEVDVNGEMIRGDSDTLGCCTYENEADFRRDAYFDDMRKSALDSLRERLVEVVPPPTLYGEMDCETIDVSNHRDGVRAMIEPGTEVTVRIVNPDAEEGANECVGPLDWFNSARVTADPSDDAIHFSVSIDDPRGALGFTVRRIQAGEKAGQIVIHLPHPDGTWQHVHVADDHPGTLIIVDEKGKPRTF